MKIVSLLPSATEIVYALGVEGSLRGVSFECDHPPPARALPRVSGTSLPSGREMTPSRIDAEVSSRVAAGESIYTLDDRLIRRIQPDLILTQDLCRVCAVPSGEVQDALDLLGCRAEVVSLDPHRLDEVIGCIETVGGVTGTAERAEEVSSALRGRIECVRAATGGRPRPRVLALEWSDPPFSAGHWVPDMVEAAGGTSLLADPGDRSRRLSWSEVAEVGADIVVFMPCGFDLQGAVDQAAPLLKRAELSGAGAFWAVDANGYFSRPGPRVVDGVEMLAQMFRDPGRSPAAARRLR